MVRSSRRLLAAAALGAALGAALAPIASPSLAGRAASASAGRLAHLATTRLDQLPVAPMALSPAQSPARRLSQGSAVVRLELVSRYAAPAYGIAVDGTRFGLVDVYQQLQVVSADNPAAPAPIGVGTLTSLGEDLILAGGTAYVAGGSNGFASSLLGPSGAPGAPAYAGSTGYARDVAVRGGYAYVAAGAGGLHAFDARNPAAPRWSAEIGYPGDDASGIAVIGDAVYVANGANGVYVFDAGANAESPSVIGALEVPIAARHVAAAGARAVVVGGTGLVVLDVTDSRRPLVRGQLAGLVEARRVAMLGSWAFVADRAGGLRVVDVADPDRPRLATTYPAPDARDVAVSGDLIYLLDRIEGVSILRFSAGTPTPTATNTATSTPTPTATNTPTITPTPTRTPEPTPTPVTRRVFVPWLDNGES